MLCRRLQILELIAAFRLNFKLQGAAPGPQVNGMRMRALSPRLRATLASRRISIERALANLQAPDHTKIRFLQWSLRHVTHASEPAIFRSVPLGSRSIVAPCDTTMRLREGNSAQRRSCAATAGLSL